jgi:hypothetical protein
MRKLIQIGSMVMAGLLTMQVQAASLTAGRNTKSAQVTYVTLGVASNTIIYAGAMVAVTNIGNVGYAINAIDSAGMTVLGCANQTVNNLSGASGAGANGALTIPVKVGTFYWDLSDTATYSNKASIGQVAYVVDNHSVSVSGGGLTGNLIAGIVKDYDAVNNLIAVDTYSVGAAGASTPSSLTVSGAATVGSLSCGGAAGITGAATLSSTLAVTGASTLTGALTVGGAISCANGTVTLLNIPTSANGLTTGMLWSNSGVLTLKP